MTNQDIEGHQALKIFPYEDQDSRFSNFLALSNQDIAALICGHQEKADRLQDEVVELRATVTSQGDELTALRDSMETQKLVIAELEKRAFDHIKTVMENLNQLRAKKAAPTEKTSPHLDKLAAHLMKKREAKQFPAIGFKEASQLLGISKRRVSQLQPTIKADGRFIVQAHGKTLYIQLR